MRNMNFEVLIGTVWILLALAVAVIARHKGKSVLDEVGFWGIVFPPLGIVALLLLPRVAGRSKSKHRGEMVECPECGRWFRMPRDYCPSCGTWLGEQT